MSQSRSSDHQLNSALMSRLSIGPSFLGWFDGHFYNISKLAVENYTTLHQEFPKAKVNDLRLQVFKSINEDFSHGATLLWEDIKSSLVARLGVDIAIQRQFNFSIHMPGDLDGILDAHSDSWSGETPFQLNAWIPLTDVDGTNSMFLFDVGASCAFKKHMATTGSYANMPEELSGRDHMLSLRRGEAMLFNPDLVHGNLENSTDSTRLSINIRFKGLWHPESRDAGLGIRSRGKFFRPLTISHNSRYALEALVVDFEDAIVE